MTFEDLLRGHMERCEYGTRRLASDMTERGCVVSMKKVQRWLRGSTRPMRWDLDALMRTLRLKSVDRWEFLEAYVD